MHQMAAVELPAEIIDQVSVHYSRMVSNDKSQLLMNLFQILKDVEGVEDADSRYVCPLPTVSPPGSRRRSMAQIRLVNRAFHDIATPRLFRNFDARFSPSSSDGPRRWASKLLDLSESPLADHIKTLEIGFARAWVYHNNPSPFLMEAAFAIPTLMRACNQLRVLSISGSVRTSVLRVDQDEQYYDIFMKTIEVTLRSFSRNSFHATLDTLEMRLPLAYDYARLATSLAPVSSIQHLEIAISDASGSGGGRFDYGGDSHRHRSHPNRAHTAGFWNFITTIAANLQSLCIACTHVLDLDLLPIDDLDCLRELVLRRVQMSQRKFVHFTTQNASSLRAIELDRV